MSYIGQVTYSIFHPRVNLTLVLLFCLATPDECYITCLLAKFSMPTSKKCFGVPFLCVCPAPVGCVMVMPVQ